MNRKFLWLILPFIALIFVAFQQNSESTYQLRESVLMDAILKHLTKLHFQPVAIDDKYSEDVFDVYLDRLDPAKRLLIQSEIDALKKHLHSIDNEVNNATFDFFDESVTYIETANARAQMIFDELIQEEFDFSKRETIETDQENLMVCENEVDLKERWRMNLKLQILDEIVDLQYKQEAEDFEGNVLEMDSIVIKSTNRVKKRFERWFNNREKNRRLDWLTTYMNSITTTFDPHTSYFKPKDKQDFNMRMSNRLEGIGARLTQDDDYVKIVDIVPGGPSWKQGGLDADDLILKVAQEDEEAIDVVGWHIDDVISKIRGPKGTKVRLTVRKVNGSEKEVPIIRDVIIFDEGYVKSFVIGHEEVSEKIGYINLPSFYFSSGQKDGRNSGRDVKLELEKLKEEGVDGVILDLRNNSGGSLRDVVEMSGLFIERGPIVQVKSRDVSSNVLKDHDPSVVYGGPLIVLVNQYSASASEILAAAMKDYERAVIMGSTTFGKGTVQRFYDLDRSLNGNNELKPLGELKITTQKFFRVNGGATQLKGVEPDIYVPNAYANLVSGEDEYEHAIQWTSIEKAGDYKQEVYDLSNLPKLVELSNARTAKNPVLNRVQEYAQILKRNRDRSVFELDFDSYRSERDKIKATFDKYEKLYPELEGIQVNNLAVDYELIQADSSKIERNESLIKGLKKDTELEEAIFVIRDMIQLNPSLGMNAE